MSNPPLIFSAEAIDQALAMRESSRPLLRVYVEGKGCDGFYYGVAFDNERRPDDTALEINGLTILVDKDSLSFMEGSKVVWVDDERGRGFLVENPKQRAYRGKFYKRKDWQAQQKTTEQTRPSE